MNKIYLVLLLITLWCNSCLVQMNRVELLEADTLFQEVEQALVNGRLDLSDSLIQTGFALGLSEGELDYATLLILKGRLKKEQSMHRESLILYEKACAIRQNLLGRKHAATSEATYRIGDAYFRLGKRETALDSVTVSTSLHLAALQLDTVLLADQYVFLAGLTAYHKREFSAARDIANKAKKLLWAYYPEGDHRRASVLQVMAVIDMLEGDQPQAINGFKSCIELLENSSKPDWPRIASLYWNMGYAYAASRMHVEEKEAYLKILAIYEDMYGRGNSKLCGVLTDLGDVSANLGEIEQGISYSERSIDLLLSQPLVDSVALYKAHFYCDRLYNKIGDYARARPHNEKTLELYESLSLEDNDLPAVLNSRGAYFFNTRNYNKALSFNLNAYQIIRDDDKFSAEQESRMAHRLGETYIELGDYESARYYLRESVRLLKNEIGLLEPNMLYCEIYQGLSYLNFKLGNYAESIAFSRRVKENYTTKNPVTKIDDNVYWRYLRQMGSSYYQLGVLDSAEWYIKQAVNLGSTAHYDGHPDVVRSNNLYAKILFAKKKYPEALALRQHSLKEVKGRGLRAHPEHWNALFYVGQTYNASDDYEMAIPYLLHALEVRPKENKRAARYFTRIYHALGKSYEGLGEFETAQAYYDSTLLNMTSLPNASIDPEFRRAAANDNRAVLTALLDREFSSERTTKVRYANLFLSADLFQHDALRQHLYFSNGLKQIGIDSLLQHDRDSLRERLMSLDHQLGDLHQREAGEEEMLLAHIARDDVSIRLQEINYTISEEAARNNALLASDQLFSLPGLQSILRPKQTLLEYFIGEEHIYIFIVNRNGVEVVSVKRPEDLGGLVRRFTQEGIYGFYGKPLKERDKSNLDCIGNMVVAGSQLYDLLIAPAKPFLTDSDALVVVPDGILGFIPFEILLTKEVTESKYERFGSQSYLLNDYAISYAYSARTLHFQCSNSTMGNKPEVLAFAPFADQKEEAGIDTVKEKPLRPAESLLYYPPTNLPYSRQMVYSISKEWDGKFLIGEQAGLDRFLELSDAYSIIHLATHALADDELGDFGFIAFGNRRNEKAQYLFARDIYHLNLPADMVVLSACETGLGAILKGEGIISLGRSFTFAGSKSVFSTLWKIPDSPEWVTLMTNFYSNLKSGGMPKDVALQQAKLDYLREAVGAAKHPFFWAALLGEGKMDALSH